MMMTSYFGNLAEVASPISISLHPPLWYEGNVYPYLAPTRGILKDRKAGLLTNIQYAERFHTEVLAKLSPLNVWCDLTAIGGYDAVLLCFEKPGEFCHRRLVADWLSSKLDKYIPEQATATWRPETNHDLLSF